MNPFLCRVAQDPNWNRHRTVYRGNFNRYTKRPLQDSAIIFSTPGMGGSAFYCANHRVSCKCQQPPGWKIHRFFRWKMPFAVFRSGSGISEFIKEPKSEPETLELLSGNCNWNRTRPSETFLKQGENPLPRGTARTES